MIQHSRRVRRVVGLDKVGRRYSPRTLLVSILTGSGNHSIQNAGLVARFTVTLLTETVSLFQRSHSCTTNQHGIIHHHFAPGGRRSFDRLRRTWRPCAPQGLAREAIACVHG